MGGRGATSSQGNAINSIKLKRGSYQVLKNQRGQRRCGRNSSRQDVYL